MTARLVTCLALRLGRAGNPGLDAAKRDIPRTSKREQTSLFRGPTISGKSTRWNNTLTVPRAWPKGRPDLDVRVITLFAILFVVLTRNVVNDENVWSEYTPSVPF
jgi:hypothetical protein